MERNKLLRISLITFLCTFFLIKEMWWLPLINTALLYFLINEKQSGKRVFLVSVLASAFSSGLSGLILCLLNLNQFTQSVLDSCIFTMECFVVIGFPFYLFGSLLMMLSQQEAK